MYHVLHFPLCTSTLLFPCLPFFFINSTQKQVLSIKRVILAFVKDRSSVDLLQKAAMAIPLKILQNTEYLLYFKIV